jgi:hypothetical protein
MIVRHHHIDRGAFQGAERLLRVVPLLLAAVLGACASDPTEPSPEQQRAVWEAQNVYPQNYKAEILAYMRNYLNEPGSVRDAFVSPPELAPMGLGNRYVSCVRYGSKRGAETNPAKPHVAIFVGGKFDAFRDAKDLCGNVAYAPFPELERLTR